MDDLKERITKLLYRAQGRLTREQHLEFLHWLKEQSQIRTSQLIRQGTTEATR